MFLQKIQLLTLSISTVICATTATIDYEIQSKISPLIYGYNQNHEDSTQAEMNLHSRRLGGNRMSTFNWEENVENSGEGTNSSFCYIQNTILKGLWNDQFIAGSAYSKFHSDNLANDLTSIITVPLLGWVAADKNRAVSTGPQGADSLRWKELVYKKGSEFTTTPDTSDRFVYLDESINYLVETFGDATTATGVKYISLGNEPALWDNTHELLQEEPPSAEEYVHKVIAAAAAVKAVDPNIAVIAGEFAGINLFDFGSAPDWSVVGANYSWFIDYFLDELKQASDSVGFDLIDILAIHNYPQHKIDASGNFSSGGSIVRTSTETSDHIRSARMSFARSLWDTTYIEPSWITKSKINGESHNVIGRVQKSIDTYYPELGIMFGELDYGHNTDISHALAITDMLGVMGNRGVEIVNRWDLENSSDNTHTRAAYKLFRNYDGDASTFGDISLKVDFDTRETSSLWASIDSTTDALHIIAINKHLNSDEEFSVNLDNSYDNSNISIYGFDSSSPQITERSPNIANSGDELRFTVPNISAYHIVINRDKKVAIHSSDQLFKNTTSVRSTNNGLVIDGVTSSTNVSIFSSNGRQLQKSVTSTGVVNSSLPSGVYFVHIDQLGSVVHKVVIQ